MNLVDFLVEGGVRALILPTPHVEVPPEYTKRYGFKAYMVTFRRAESEKPWSVPFFSTEEPYTAQIIRSLASQARWYEEGPEQGDDSLAEFEESLDGARKLADALKAFLGDELYETLILEIELDL